MLSTVPRKEDITGQTKRGVIWDHLKYYRTQTVVADHFETTDFIVNKQVDYYKQCKLKKTVFHLESVFLK